MINIDIVQHIAKLQQHIYQRTLIELVFHLVQVIFMKITMVTKDVSRSQELKIAIMIQLELIETA